MEQPDKAAAMQAVLDTLTLTLTRAADFVIDFRIICADGWVRQLRSAADIKCKARDLMRHMVGVNWDATATRELSAALGAQHERLRATLQSIGGAAITTDGQSRVSWLNPMAERMTGWLTAATASMPGSTPTG